MNNNESLRNSQQRASHPKKFVITIKISVLSFQDQHPVKGEPPDPLRTLQEPH
jgi:hypothetical protein